MKATSPVGLAVIAFSILAASLAHAATPYHAADHEHDGAVQLESYAAGANSQIAPQEAAGLARAKRSEVILFDIEADTVACEGVAPMRCLVVNGEYFYDVIDGYRHVEGQPARIYVERSERSEPVPADAGDFFTDASTSPDRCGAIDRALRRASARRAIPPGRPIRRS